MKVSSLQFPFFSCSSHFKKVFRLRLNSAAFSTLLLSLCLLLLQCSAWKDDKDESEERETIEMVYTPEEIDNFVGYGEDCSSEGPFCDARQHLACDNEEEICVCDDKNGYVHVESSLSEDEDIMDLLQDQELDEEGTSSSKKICMKAVDLEYKMDRLLNITKKIKDFADIFRKYKKYLPKKYQDLLKEEL